MQQHHHRYQHEQQHNSNGLGDNDESLGYERHYDHVYSGGGGGGDIHQHRNIKYDNKVRSGSIITPELFSTQSHQHQHQQKRI